jgi:hypothetical protein
MQAGAVATGLPHMILMLVSIVRCVKSLIRDIRA